MRIEGWGKGGVEDGVERVAVDEKVLAKHPVWMELVPYAPIFNLRWTG